MGIEISKGVQEIDSFDEEESIYSKTEEIEVEKSNTNKENLDFENEEFEPTVVKVLDGHNSFVHHVCFSPEQTELCSVGCHSNVVLRSLEEPFQIISKLFGHRSSVRSVDYSPCGRFIATGSHDKTIRLWNRERNLESYVVREDRTVKCVCFNSNGKKLIYGAKFGSSNPSFKIWDLEMRECVFSQQSEDNEVDTNCISLTSDDRFALSSHNGPPNVVKLWDFRTLKCVHTFKEYPNKVKTVKFHPDNIRFASGCWDGTVKLFDIRNYRILQNIDHKYSTECLDFDPSGNYLLSGNGDHTIRIYSLLMKDVIIRKKKHRAFVRCVQFSPDGKYFASSAYCWDEVILWKSNLLMTSQSKYAGLDLRERVLYLLDLFSKSYDQEEGSLFFHHFVLDVKQSESVRKKIVVSKVFIL